MGAQHTPGPWAVSKNSSGRRVTSTTGIVICNAVLRNTGRADRGIKHGSKEHKEAEANARLIAAAPDYDAAAELALPLLEADRRTFFDCHTINGDPHSLTNDEALQVAAYDVAIRALKSAIAKARGAA